MHVICSDTISRMATVDAVVRGVSAAMKTPAPLGPPDLLSIVIGSILILTILTPVLCLVNVVRARRQWREGRGGWLRLFWVSGVIALLQVSPLIAYVLVHNSVDSLIQDRMLPAVMLVVWSWLLLTLGIGRPVRLAHSKDELPLVEDEQFNSRVEELASAMHLKTPVVRLVRSLGGEQQTAAFAGGLAAPSLVVTDGILHRLAPDERDAVVGHELAHLANASLWWLTCVTPMAALGGLLTAGLAGGWFAVLFGLALRVGLLRIVSRYFERDCDRRAAEVIGFGTMASALRKIHAVHVLRDTGWRSVLIYSTGTHPSQVERLAALELSAPDDDLPENESLTSEYRHRILAARTAAAVWCSVMILTMVGQSFWPASIWPTALLIGVLTVPFWPLLDAWRQFRRVRKRTRQGGLRRLVGLTISLLAVAAFYFADEVSVFHRSFLGIQTMELVAVACGLFGLLLFAGGHGSHKTGRIRQQLLKALQEHDFEAAARIGTEHAKVIGRVAELRHNVAVARILSGDRESGIADLQDNVEHHPRFVQSLLTLSTFYFDAGEYESACQAAARAADKLKDDPEPLLKQSAALWRLGRLDEAESVARRAIQLEPDAGEPHAVLAGVLIERGDSEGAGAALETAERLSPGSPFIRVVEAEAALRFAEPAVARMAVERASEAARANPFAVIDRQVERLEAGLPNADRSTDDVNDVIAADSADQTEDQ